MLRICSLLVLSLLLGLPAAAGTISGSARVIDGDTLDVAGTRIRLHGIDAPELSQTCKLDGRDWACGVWARDEVARRIGRQRIDCTALGQDRYGRTLATCRLGGADLGEALVREGLAYAFRRYALDYVDAEKEAMFAGRGLWSGEVEPPEAVRAAERAAAGSGTQAPEGCVIKGNISASGRIYHLPGQADYAATRIDTSRGERWFCSEAEARAAGWRRARR